MAVRWKMNPKETGLRSVGAGPRGSNLHAEDGSILMSTSSVGGGWRGPIEGWYWYGMGMNTCRQPLYATEADARVAARLYYDEKTK